MHCPKCKLAFESIDDYHDHWQQFLFLVDLTRHGETTSCKLRLDNAQPLNVHPEVVDVETVLHNTGT